MPDVPPPKEVHSLEEKFKEYLRSSIATEFRNKYFDLKLKRKFGISLSKEIWHLPFSYDTLTDRQRQYIEKRLAEEVPIDLRPLDPEGHFRIAGEEREPKQMYWIKARGYIGV